MRASGHRTRAILCANFVEYVNSASAFGARADGRFQLSFRGSCAACLCILVLACAHVCASLRCKSMFLAFWQLLVGDKGPDASCTDEAAGGMGQQIIVRKSASLMDPHMSVLFIKN